MRRALLVLVLVACVAAAAGVAYARHHRAEYRAGQVPLLPLGRDGVVLVVTDNVRADHTSLCGYRRPTTPALSALAARPGAVHTCRAYAPGSWTLPTHASFFTGVGVLDHGAHEYRGSVKDPRGSGIVTHKLDSRLPTLADQMAGRGYQTVLLAGNPVVGVGTGLARGFEHRVVARAFGDKDWPELVDDLRRVLREDLDPLGGPLFLVANLAEAHRPWKGVPEGHDFLPRRGKLQFDNEDYDGAWRRFLEGRMEGESAARFLAQVNDVYDYGIERADAGLAAILSSAREVGWCRDECRVVVTSDHGEFIGEHGLVDHGFYTWEANSRVFVVAAGTGAGSLPEPLSATAVFHLVRDGKLPAQLPEVSSAAWPHVRRSLHTVGKAFGSVSAARWSGQHKETWIDGQFMSFDLDVDPFEARPAALSPDADFAGFAARVEAAATVAPAKRKAGVADDDAALMEALEAAGYME